MAVPVEMPKLGNTVEECLLARWLKAKGDDVREGETIAEIETDKATFELAAPASGVLLEKFAEQGELVAVFTNIAAIGVAGEPVESFRPKAEQLRGSEESHESAQPKPSRAREQAVVGSSQTLSGSSALSPRARRFALEHDFHPEGVHGSGPGGRVLEQDLREMFFSQPRLSALARARTADGQEAPLSGSGPNGMVLSQDLGPAPSALPGIRATIARRMREALSASAQYTLHSSADARALLALRATVKRVRAARALPDVNINDLVLFCAVKALLRMPEVNASFRDGKLYKNAAVHLGFACDTDRGLLVPVVKNAQDLTLPELSERVKALAAQAVAGAISPDDLSGATFTVSNLGGLGIESFTPILAPPQVAILGVNAIQLRPVREDGEVVFVDRIGFSLTCDHQIVDGAPGARFLEILRDCVERVRELAGREFSEEPCTT